MKIGVAVSWALVAVCVWLGAVNLYAAWSNTGGGVLAYSASRPDPRTGDPGGERERRVPEAVYKRDRYVAGCAMLAIGGFIAGCVLYARRHR